MNRQGEPGVLVINPGNTSTKVAYFDREEVVLRESIEHSATELEQFKRSVDQLDYRRGLLEGMLDPLLAARGLLALSARGGPLKPLDGGTYLVNDAMLRDLRSCRYADHASNLGALLADQFAKRLGVRAYVVDPVTVDEFQPVARLSGLREIARKSRSHALNIKAVGRIAATKLGKEPEEANLVVLHLGSGFSICALRKGRIIDVNDGLLGMGPFSVNRAGALPIGPLVKLCYSGSWTEEEMLKKLSSESGLVSYVGTSDMRKALEKMEAGDGEARLAVDGMIYQVAKEGGACAAAMRSPVDAVVLTGGLAFADYIVEELRGYLSFIAPFIVLPGEFEMEALARGVYRVLDGGERAKTYE